MFMKFWTAVSRGDYSNLVLSPIRFGQHLPLTLNPNTNHHKRDIGTTKNKITAKSFVFSNSATSTLKAKYTATTTIAIIANNKTIHNNPTRVEALSTFIWCRYKAAIRGEAVCGKGIRYLAIQGVNLRTRFNSPLPNSYYGNLSQFAIAILAPPALEKGAIGEDRGSLVTQMIDGIRKVNSDYVRKLQEGGAVMEGLNSKKEEGGNKGGGGGEAVFTLVFSSIARFSLYKTYFGWGRPVWVTLGVVNLDNMVVFLPTKSGDIIEALILMNKGDLAKLETDKEFLSFVSNPKFPLLSSL